MNGQWPGAVNSKAWRRVPAVRLLAYVWLTLGVIAADALSSEEGDYQARWEESEYQTRREEREMGDMVYMSALDNMRELLERGRSLAELVEIAKELATVANVSTTDTSIGAELVNILSAVIDAKGNSLEKAQKKANATTQFIQAVENYLYHVVPSKEDDFTINLSSQYIASAYTLQSMNDPELIPQFVAKNDTDSSSAEMRSCSADTDYCGLDDQDVLARILLPKEIAGKNNTLWDGRLPVFSTVYTKGTFFIKKTNATSNRRLNSVVMAVNVGLSDELEFDNSVIQIQFMPLQNGTDPICMLWDFDLNDNGGWSGEDCWLADAQPGGLITCECSHLTNFALFMTVDKPLGSSWWTVSYFGYLIAVLFDLLTLFIVLVLIPLGRLIDVASKYAPYCRKLWCHMRIKIFSQITLSMAVVSVLVLPTAWSSVRENSSLCRALSVLTHYFCLSLFCWMLVQGFYIRRVLIRVYSREISHLFGKMCAFAWGLPLPIVLATMASDGFQLDAYHRRIGSKPSGWKVYMCFLREETYYISFFIPLSLILAINGVIFVNILRKVAAKRQSQCSAGKARRSNSISFQRQMMAAGSLAVVLGLTWIPVAIIINVISLNSAEILFSTAMALCSVVLFTCAVLMREIQDEAARRLRPIMYTLRLSRRHRSPSPPRIEIDMYVHNCSRQSGPENTQRKISNANDNSSLSTYITDESGETRTESNNGIQNHNRQNQSIQNQEQKTGNFLQPTV